jgi:hypothetical protein
MVRVDGSPGIVATLLHHGVKSPHTVACLLHVTSRSAPYCHCHVVSMSCIYLMLVIHCIWLVLYAYNVLPALRAW